MFPQNIDLKVENAMSLSRTCDFFYSGKKSEQVHIYCGCQVWDVPVPFKL